MRHPFESWPAHHRRGVFVALLVMTVFAWLMLAWIESDLRDAGTRGQVSLQFAGNRTDAAAVVHKWEAAHVMHKAGLSLGFDYVFLGLYSATLSAACAGIALRCRRRNWSGMAGLGAFMGFMVWAAGGLDAAENALMVPILSNPEHGGAPGLVQAIALTKVLILVSAVVYVIAAGLSSARARETLFKSATLPGA